MNTIKVSYSSIVLSLLSLVSVLFVGVNSAIAAVPQFNNASNDLDTVRIGNSTTSAGTYSWASSVTGQTGDRIAIDVYYHNTVDGTNATNTKVKVSVPSTSAGTQKVFSGLLWADNAAQVSGSATLNITSSQSITFENTARWLPNQSTSGGTMIPVTNNGNSVQVNIGSIAGGWPSQGHVTFFANISNTVVNENPVVNAGSDISVNEGQSVAFSATATDPQGDPMTYTWSCTGGSLSSSTALNPTYSAPSVSSTTTYTCTLTARDNKGNSDTDTKSVTVVNTGNPSENPTANVGNDVTVNEGNSVNLSGSANDPQGDPMTYTWSCTGGSLSSSTALNPTYYAPSVSSTTTYTCTLTARDNSGHTGSDTMNVTVIDSGNSNENPTVEAGSNISVTSGGNAILSGYANDPQGDPMTYAWSCTSGSLSNYNSLSTTYYAPSVSSTTSYTCTLTARDNKGYTGSDTVMVTVNNGGWFSPELNVSLSASPSSGSAPLNGVDLTANVNSIGLSDYPVIYRFDCQNDNSWDIVANSNNTNYTAYDMCNYYNDGTYTAKVKVERGGYVAYAQATIVVGGQNTYSGISVDAGTNKDIQENQSTTLNGYAYSQYGYSLNQYWSCNGGSLSNSNSLNPTYYAPSVNSDITYTCTLYVTDSRGYSNSDTVNIVVRNYGSGYSNGLAVTTNTPVVGTTSATLNGILTNDGGQYSSVRFNWGRLSSYSNSTPWTTNRYTGQTFDYYVSGLEKGKAYHFRAEASNGRETVVGQDVTFVTKPDAVTGFTALAAGSNQISLNWNKSASSCYTIVTRKTGSYPNNSADGTVVYYGTGSSVVDSNLANNVWYYYKAWAVGCDEGMYSYSDAQYSRAYTTGGYVPVVTPTKAEISLEGLVRNVTQKETAWQNSITANPKDEVEFRVIITSTGTKLLENVVLKTIVSDKITAINDIKIDNQSYSGSLSLNMDIGTIALGESKVITFKGKVDDVSSFSYGSNELINTIEVSAKGADTVKRTATINVIRGAEAGAGLISLVNLQAYAGLLTLLFLILCIIVMYLLIERKKERECLAEREASTKVEKSKYFNIK
ncbi:MAG: PKD domain-containing protein [Minisyncoccales bacterium]